MTARDFNTVAEVLREARDSMPHAAHRELVSKFADRFVAESPTFNRDYFTVASSVDVVPSYPRSGRERVTIGRIAATLR